MKVIALREGFFDGATRKAGDEFEVPEGAKALWFAPVDSVKADKPVAAKKVAKAAPTTLSEAGKEGSKTFVQANSGDADLA